MGEGFFPKDEFDDENIHIDDHFCHTTTYFERLPFLRWEFTTSCHEMNYIEYVEFLNHFQHMDEENLQKIIF